METAIPAHLQRERLRHRRVSDEHVPPYSAVVGRFGPAVSRLIVGCFGIQYLGDVMPAQAKIALAHLSESLSATDGPSHCERASNLDSASFTNIVSIGYWKDSTAFEAWFSLYGIGWTGYDLYPGLGRFTEVLRPKVERIETITEPGVAEGFVALADDMSGPILESGYWGAARDRIPLSQTHDLSPAGSLHIVIDGLRKRVVPHENLCLIRSGQDWSHTDGAERDMYLMEVQPLLRDSMKFLDDEGLSLDCYANRYMTVIDTNGHPTEKTFGMSWWRSLSALEKWAGSHWTHLDLYTAAAKLYSSFGANTKLLRWHEVAIATSDEQFFEYHGCHAKTGLLNFSLP